MKKLPYILALLLFITACKKENNAITFSGNYQGQQIIYSNHSLETHESEINLSSPNFSVLKGIKKGSGTFAVTNKMEVVFTDTNVWTADFNWHILLNGSYKYEALGDSLILTKYIGENKENYYQYRLKRVDE
ncbi:MAG: hypothetical protein REI78_12210 [Pedobacter sp.]|nr:hypothetical protein [Pedobacter sp.]MDQ8053787.1 hypothetical protein [Pedobacter sp.]